MKQLHKKEKVETELLFYHSANESCNGKPISNNNCTTNCGPMGQNLDKPKVFPFPIGP